MQNTWFVGPITCQHSKHHMYRGFCLRNNSFLFRDRRVDSHSTAFPKYFLKTKFAFKFFPKTRWNEKLTCWSGILSGYSDPQHSLGFWNLPFVLRHSLLYFQLSLVARFLWKSLLNLSSWRARVSAHRLSHSQIFLLHVPTGFTEWQF